MLNLSVTTFIVGHYKAFNQKLSNCHLQFGFFICDLLIDQHAVDKLIDNFLSIDEFGKQVVVICLMWILIPLESLNDSESLIETS